MSWSRPENWVSIAIVAGAIVSGIVSDELPLGWISIGLYAAVGVLSIVGIGIGVWWFRPRSAWPWLLFGGAILVSSVGDVLWSATELTAHLPGYASELASVLYLSSYPMYIAAALGLLGWRAIRRDATVLLDAVVMAGGVWLVLWVIWVHPQMAQSGLRFWDVLPTVVYPPLDFVVLVVLWRLGRGDLRRSAPWILLALGFGVMFAADTVYAVANMPSDGWLGIALDVGWIVSYACVAAATLRPTMRFVRGAPDPVRPGSDRVRVGATIFALLSPLVLLLVAPEDVMGMSTVVAVTGLALAAAATLRFLVAGEHDRRAESLLAYRATHDPLTGLLNRSSLVDSLRLATMRALRSRRSCADVFAPPFELAHREISISASIGIVPAAERHVDTVEAALRDADLAMYEAKALEHGQLCVFTPEMRTRVMDRLEIKNALQRAVPDDELELDFQPIYSTATGAPIAFEALVRWIRAGVLVPPDEFIPVAESSGAIVAIGEWVLRRAVGELADRHDAAGLRLSVNVSPRQLRVPGFAESAVDIMRAAGVEPERVMFEITESALVESDPTIDANLRSIETAGFEIAIDDFGTGYSSLAYLKRLAVDWIKIDRMFIEDLGRNANDTTIVRMADELGVKVIAEGVETSLQLRMLEENGCDAVQGFLLAGPSRRPSLEPHPRWADERIS